MAAPFQAPESISFRPVTRADFVTLTGWFTEPHVAKWWTEATTVDGLEREYGPALDGSDPTEMFIVEHDNEPVGFIQRYRLVDHPKWDATVGIPAAAGIDYFIGVPTLVGRGFGSAAIRRFVAALLAADSYSGIEAVVAVPQQANVASWRALEKAGFVRERAVDDLHSDDPDDKGPAYICVFRR